MNETHTFHNSSGFFFPPRSPLLCKTMRHCRSREEIPIQQAAAAAPFSLSHVFPPVSPSFLLRSLFPYLSCYLYELTPAHAGQLRNGRFPWGRQRRQVEEGVCVKASVWPSGHPCTEGPLCTSPLYNTSTLLHSAPAPFTPFPFSAAAANPAHWHFHVHTHTHKHTSNCYPPFIVGRDHSFFPGREACRELCGSEPRALAVAACDAAANSNRVPLVWNILLLCLLLRWE